jgi:hypothetical protein
MKCTSHQETFFLASDLPTRFKKQYADLTSRYKKLYAGNSKQIDEVIIPSFGMQIDHSNISLRISQLGMRASIVCSSVITGIIKTTFHKVDRDVLLISAI